MKTITTWTAVITLTLTLAALAFAAVPQTINYQGYLKNTNGTPVVSATSVRFSLYSSTPPRNNPVWRETKSVTPASGIYSTQLGSVTPITAPFDVPYYLGVQVGTDPEMALQPLGSSPYALNANSLDGFDSTAFAPSGHGHSSLDSPNGALLNVVTVDTAGKVGIGTETPAGELHVTKPQVVSPITFSGIPVGNNLSVNTAAYKGTGVTSYVVRVQNAGPSPDVIEFSANGGSTWSAPVNMVASGLNVGNNVLIGFSSLDGHTYGDQWAWTVAQGFPDGLIVADGKVTVQDIAIATGAVNGYVLTSDATGTATWQPTAPDADNNTTNELNSSFTMSGTTLSVTDAGGAKSVDLAEKLALANLSDAKSDSTSLFLGPGSGAVDDGVNYNVGVGTNALNANTTGVANTASGMYALSSNTTGYSNTASGMYALRFNTTGNYNTASGYRALYTNTTGSFNTALGYGADVSLGDLTNATAIGSGASVNASNKVRIGNSSVAVIEGQVAWSTPSDIRLKKDVADIGFGLSLITSLRPVQYRLKEGNNRIDFGFIAQEVEATLGDNYNVLGIGEDAQRSLSLRYTDFIAPLVKAVQEQQTMISNQQATIDQLKSELAEIKKLLGR